MNKLWRKRFIFRGTRSLPVRHTLHTFKATQRLENPTQKSIQRLQYAAENNNNESNNYFSGQSRKEVHFTGKSKTSDLLDWDWSMATHKIRTVRHVNNNNNRNNICL